MRVLAFGRRLAEGAAPAAEAEALAGSFAHGAPILVSPVTWCTFTLPRKPLRALYGAQPIVKLRLSR
jgi:hypothetical protein